MRLDHCTKYTVRTYEYRIAFTISQVLQNALSVVVHGRDVMRHALSVKPYCGFALMEKPHRTLNVVNVEVMVTQHKRERFAFT